MRYIVTAVIAALILSTASYQSQGIYIHSWGNHSCGKYLAAIHGHAPGKAKGFNDQGSHFSDDHAIYIAWLGGFFSAMNWLVLDEPNGIQSDGAAIDVWVRKWCEQNPTKPLAQAALEFARDQRKDYLDAFFARQAR
jgi:hypothetical protein